MNKANPIYTQLLKLYRSSRDEYYYLRRRPFIGTIHEAIGTDTSIISSNCFAGRIMQDLHMKYNSPTLGLYFMYPDYIMFLSDLEHYLTEGRLDFVEHSKYPLGDERRATWKHWYPIGLLNGKIEIHFLHYFSEEEASSKWYRRAARVNFKKLLVIGMDQNLCEPKDIETFDHLPFKHKMFFSARNIGGGV